MSGASRLLSPGDGDAGGSGSRSSTHNSGGGGKNTARGSSGTTQLLDRLGYGLVSPSSSLDAAGPESVKTICSGTARSQGGVPSDCRFRPRQQCVNEKLCPTHAANEETLSDGERLIPAAADPPRSFPSLPPQRQPQQRQPMLPPAAVANLISLSRIRKLVTAPNNGGAARIQHEKTGSEGGGGCGIVGAAMESGGGDVELPGATHASPVPGGVSGGKRRNSPTNPDPAAVFRGVRVLLEQQNGGDKSGSEQVALECLSVLKESVSWLSRTLAKKDVPAASAGSAVQVLPAGRRVNGPAAAQGRDQGTSFHALSAAAVISNKSCSSTHRTTSISATTAAATTTATATETPAATMVSPPPQLQGPGHDFHAARACVASMLPSVIDCCSRESLRGSAEDVLAECAAASELPGVPSILVDQLVYHGMEHDDESVRLWSTRTPSRLLTRGLMLGKREHGSLVKGLVGRVRDVNEGVVDAAVDELGRMYLAEPETFRAAEACLDSAHRQLLQHYSERIHSQGRRSDADDGQQAGGIETAETVAAAAMPGSGSITREDAGDRGTPAGASAALSEGGPVADEPGQTVTLVVSPKRQSNPTPAGSRLDDGVEEDGDEEDATIGSGSFVGQSARGSSSGSSSSSSSSGGSRSGRCSSDGSGEGKEGREEEEEGEDGEEKGEEQGEESDAEEEARPKFESTTDVVNVTGKWTGSDSEGPGEQGDTIGTDETTQNNQVHRQQRQHREHQVALQRGAHPPSPPRPILAGPTAIQVPATLGSEGGIGVCALTAPVAATAAASGREKLRGVEKELGGAARGGGRGMAGISGDGNGHAGEGDGLRGAKVSIGGEMGEAASSSPVPCRGSRIEPFATTGRPPHEDKALSRQASPKKQRRSPAATEMAKVLPTEVVATTTSTTNVKSPPAPPGRRTPTARGGSTTVATTDATANAVLQTSQSTAPVTPSGTSGVDTDEKLSPSPLSLSELLRVLVEVEATAPGGVGAGHNGSASTSSSRKPTILQCSTPDGVERGRGGGAALIGRQSSSRTPGDLRQGRVGAMEAAKRLVSNLGTTRGGPTAPDQALVPSSASAGITTERMGELFAVALRLTDDSDFKIALLALQLVHALVLVAGERMRPPDSALIFEALAARLGDHKVAARHHAMAALSALVRSAGLPVTAPYLTRHGLRSATWRAREGALKLVMVGLLSPCRWGKGSTSTLLTTSAPSDTAAKWPVSAEMGGRHGGSTEGEERFGGGVWRDSEIAPAMGKEQLVRVVGTLLNDDRPEVLHASFEALALAASVWGETEADILQTLDSAELFSSSEKRRRLAARLRDPPLSLSHLGPDDTVVLGTALSQRRSSPEQRAGASGGTGDIPDTGDGKPSSGGAGSDPRVGTSAPRCWRTNESGEREEIAPWEGRHGSVGGDGLGGGPGNCRNDGSTSGSQVTTGDRRVAVNFHAKDAEKSSRTSSDWFADRIDRIRATGQRVNEGGAGKFSALATSPYNTGGSGGGRARSSGSMPRRHVSSPDLGSGKGDGGGDGGGRREDWGREGAREGRRETEGKEGAETEEDGRSYIPSWVVRGGDDKNRSTAAETSSSHHKTHIRRHSEQMGYRQSQRSKTSSSFVVNTDDDRASTQGGGGASHGAGASTRHSPGSGVLAGTAEHQRCPRERRWKEDDEDERRRSPSAGQEAAFPQSPRETGRLWAARDGGEEEKRSSRSGGRSRWERNQGTSVATGRGFAVGSSEDDDEDHGGRFCGGGVGRSDETRMSRKEGGSGRRCSVVPDPDLLSTLKRGGSRNAKANRRAVSAAAGGGSGGDHALSSAGRQASGGNPAYPARDDGGGDGDRGGVGGLLRPRPRGGAPAEPTTPVPVGRYDHLGRRSQMETTVQQPLPLSITKNKRAGGSDGKQGSGCTGRAAETFVTGISIDSQDDERGSGSGQARQPSTLRGVSSATKRRMERREATEREAEESMRWASANDNDEDADHNGPDVRGINGSEAWPKSHRRPGRRGAPSPPLAATRTASDGADGRIRRAERRGDVAGGGGGGVVREQRGRRSTAPAPRPGGAATVAAPSSPSSSVLAKPDSFDYLTAEDIRPSPNPSQELQRAMASLPRDDWPEIFHTLNSVRRLATHHGPLLGSQAHLHALIRDVLGQAENLRSQVAKNALLTLADLWRGLGDVLDPELPMVCPLLVKKLADKVEFLADAARECVEEIVETATGSRSLSAFLACGTHRSPPVRAKSALATLLCVRRRCYPATRNANSVATPCPTGRAATIASTSVMSRSKQGGGVGSDRIGGGGGGGGALVGGRLGAREMDRLLSALPRFLQDGNQETRHHAKAMAAVLLDTAEVDEPRLRREIPPPIFERLQRELLNPTFLSEPDFAAPPNTAAIGSRSSSSSSCYGSRNGRNSAGAISRRLGATGPASSNGLVTSTGLGSTSSTASGAGVGSGYDGDVPVSGGGEGLPRRRGEDGGAGNRWMGAGGESWRWKGDAGGRRERGGDGCVADDGIGFTGGLSSGSVSSPPKSHRSPPHSSPRFRNRAEADEGPAAGSRSSLACSPPARKGIPSVGSVGSNAKRRPGKGFRCREVELLLQDVYARLDSGDWRERLKGLEEATCLLEQRGGDLHAVGKSARLVDRMAELLSDGNLKVNLFALDGVVRLGSSMGNRLEPCVNTLVPAVCKNLASSNQQRTSLAEEALDALCEAIDPCLLMQPVASLAQYGNARLKVPMLALLRDLTPEVGEVKPTLLTKYARPAALSLVRENRPNVRDAGLSLLRAVEIALAPTPSVSSSFRARKGGRRDGPGHHRRAGDRGNSGREYEETERGGGGGVGGSDGGGGGGSGRRRRAVGTERDSGHGRVEEGFGGVRAKGQQPRRHHEPHTQSASSAAATTTSRSTVDRSRDYPNGDGGSGTLSRRR